MFKWISIIAGTLAVAGGISLAVGAASVTLIAASVITGLGIVSVASGAMHLKLKSPSSEFLKQPNKSVKFDAIEGELLTNDTNQKIASISSNKSAKLDTVKSELPTNNLNQKITSISTKKTTIAQKSKVEAAKVHLELAQYYLLETTDRKKDSKKAFDCYLEAAKLGHSDALTPLERIGDEMSATKQMELSQLYGTFFNNPEKANYWRTKAQEIEEFNFNM